MKQTDKILIGIVAGIVILVIAAFAITLTRPEETYQPEDTPEGVVHNYLLAFDNQDLERAYSYLSPDIPKYPRTLDEFIQDVEQNRWAFESNLAFSLETKSPSSNRAIVTVFANYFSGGGLFDISQNTTEFTISLKKVNGNWRIYAGERFFCWCWQ